MEKQTIKICIKDAIRKVPFSIYAYKRIKKLSKYISFMKEFSYFKSESKPNRFTIKWKDRYPCLDDKTSTVSFDRHYIFHTAWAARVLARIQPKEHVDISSWLCFSSLVSAFIPVRSYDYRSVDLNLSKLVSDTADLLALPFPDSSIMSLSCMHVIEHVGLGRYDDPIEPDGDLKAIEELKRVLTKRGNLLFVVPIGQPKVMFNAHRIYSYDQIISYFDPFELIEFALIPDNPEEGGLIGHAKREMANAQTYGCGCFWFRKKDG